MIDPRSDGSFNDPEAVYAFYDGVLTAFGRDWTIELEAWPEPRISLLRDDRPEADTWSPAHDLVYQGYVVLRKGEDTSFWAKGREQPIYIEEREINHRFMPNGLQPVTPPEDPEEEKIWRATFPSRYHIQLFWQTIPPEIRLAIHRYRSSCWSLLPVYRHCPQALDLHYSNPMLFHLLIDHYSRLHRDGNLPCDEIGKWVGRKQVEIMDFLQIPATESNRRILLKVTLESMDSFDRGILSELEKDPTLHRIVEHLPQINYGIAYILAYHLPCSHLTGPLLTEVARLENHDSASVYFEIFQDTVDLLKRAGMADKKIYAIRSMERLHDDILRRLGPEALMTESERNYTFPPPPYPGAAHIAPITSPEELFREGMEMRHCVAIYAEKVAKSECYCYRVMAPVRATLEISRDDNGNWYLSQMRGKCNRHVGDKIVDQVWSILQQSNSDTGRIRAAELYGEYDP